MRVLIACEESQTVCKAFREKGHEAYSCDIVECSGGHPEWHIQQDVLPLLNGGCSFKTMDGVDHTIEGRWDMIIAFPPCTFMSKAGARWMFANGEVNQERLKKAMAAKRFFLAIWNADCDRVVIENPTPLKIVCLPKPTQIIQPYKFDPKRKHPYSKRTCLWERGVPLLKETSPDATPISTWMPSNTGGFARGQGGGRGIAHDAKTASKTFPGIAKAMAEQYGSEISRTDCLTCRYFVECEPDMIAYHNDPCDLYKEQTRRNENEN